MGYEFDWGQIIEEVFDDIPAADSDNLEYPSYLAVRWHFVLCDVYTAFLDGGGNLAELSDLATVILAADSSCPLSRSTAARRRFYCRGARSPVLKASAAVAV